MAPIRPDRPGRRQQVFSHWTSTAMRSIPALQAGLDVLRGGSFDQPGDDRPVHRQRPAQDDPCTVCWDLDAGQVTSTITVPDNFIVQGDTTSSGISGLRVTLNLTYPNDPDLTLSLEHFDSSGDLLGTVPLATGVGSGTNQTANFTNTIFDDNATTPIQNGGAPFNATFNPQMPLSALCGDERPGKLGAGGPEQLDHGGASGTINSWSLSFQKPLPTSGLGVPGADNINVSFRIFNLGQADAMSAEAWTPVGPASIAPSGTSTSSTGGRLRTPPEPLGPCHRLGDRSVRPDRAIPSTRPVPAAASGRRPTS